MCLAGSREKQKEKLCNYVSNLIFFCYLSSNLVSELLHEPMMIEFTDKYESSRSSDAYMRQ